ncbi:MAG: DDE-type integrase/transposase/recombinase [Herminiimonas sp.]|nr:DDE-type integrase/transposase/recombinase [Herminiimonas sp.]
MNDSPHERCDINDDRFVTLLKRQSVSDTSIQADDPSTASIMRHTIVLRQSKYLNNIVDQDHRATKRVTPPMLGFKTFCCARIIIAGIGTLHMIRKGQLGDIKDQTSSAANQFFSLAF